MHLEYMQPGTNQREMRPEIRTPVITPNLVNFHSNVNTSRSARGREGNTCSPQSVNNYTIQWRVAHVHITALLLPAIGLRRWYSMMPTGSRIYIRRQGILEVRNLSSSSIWRLYFRPPPKARASILVTTLLWTLSLLFMSTQAAPIQKVHSHNDCQYLAFCVLLLKAKLFTDLQAVPLFTALNTGVTSVEADLWLEDGNLFVCSFLQSLLSSHKLVSYRLRIQRARLTLQRRLTRYTFSPWSKLLMSKHSGTFS